MLNADCLAVLGKLLAKFLAPSQNKFQTLLPHLLVPKQVLWQVLLLAQAALLLVVA
jgi:hypothetical protein